MPADSIRDLTRCLKGFVLLWADDVDGQFAVRAETIFLEMPPIWHQLLSGCSPHIFCMFSYCPEWKLYTCLSTVAALVTGASRYFFSIYDTSCSHRIECIDLQKSTQHLQMAHRNVTSSPTSVWEQPNSK